MARFDLEILPAQALARLNAGGRIGLLGGSFNPAHEGHHHISLIALRRLELDAILWLVSPQNPLKSTDDLAPLATRLERARPFATDPRIFVTALEQALGTLYTVDTIAALQRAFPKARFVWLMGSDNLAQFHRWRRWKTIARRVPIAVIARPKFTMAALSSAAARYLQPSRIDPRAAPELVRQTPPAWVFLEERLDPASSTAVRATGLWR